MYTISVQNVEDKMTNVYWFMEHAQERLKRAQLSEKQEKDSQLVKYDIECIIGYLNQAIVCIDDDCVREVCEYCGDEAEDNHIGAFCVKG
jgi:hypothetical protein